jgi:hypothetical protein
MQYRGFLLAGLAATATAACGDNRAGAPDGPGPGPTPDAGGPAACTAGVNVAGLGDEARWDSRFTIPGLTGLDGHAPTLYDFAADTDGSIVAAGEFYWLGSERVEPLVRWRDGAWEAARTTWELDPPGSGFSAVAIAPDGDLALATYDDFGPRSGEIWIDDGTGLRVIGSFEGLVRTIAWYRGDLWVAGWYQIDPGPGPAIQGLAVWNGTTWTAPPGGAADGFAFELALDGTALLVGGDFQHVGGITARAVARYNGATGAWSALNLPQAAVYAIARGPDDALYAGGALGDQGNGRGGLVRRDGNTWEPVGGGLVMRTWPGVVTDLATHDGALYASGCFRTANGGDDDPAAVVSRDVIAWDGDAWRSLDDDTGGALGPWLEPLACGDEGPSAVWDVSKQRLASAGDRLFLAGSFPGIGDTLSQALVGFDGTRWTGQGPGGQPPNGLGIAGSVDRLGAGGASCDVWGMGFFSHVAGTPTRASVVHWDGTAWTALADEIPSDAYCPALAVAATGEVAVGCMIFPPKGEPIGRVYVPDANGTALVQLGEDLPPVMALGFDGDGRLWVGGGTSTGFVGTIERGQTAMTIVADTFDGGVDRIDAGTTPGATDVIVGGFFQNVGSVAAARIARYDGAAWRSLGPGLDGMATAIAHDARYVYVSTYDEGSGAYMLGRWDGAAWTELATPGSNLTPQTYFNFNAIKVVEGGLVLGGTAGLDDEGARGALVYDAATGRFSGLGGGGVHAVGVGDIAIAGGDVWVGGSIAEAGASAVPSIGVARYRGEQ